MRQSPFLEFESSDFAVSPGEDEATNPGIYGKALAEWLASQLRAAGLTAGSVIPEDFGWCIPVAASPQQLYVVCASTEEALNEWRVFAFAEGGLAARLLGKDKSAVSLASLFTAVRSCLESNPNVRGLREQSLDA
jgi:hypothetical protein